MVLEYPPSFSGHLANQLVFGPIPANLLGRGDGDQDLSYALDTSLPGTFVQQWKLRMMAQETASEEVATSELRRRLA